MRLGIRSKLILLFAVFAIIPALLVGLFSYRISYRTLWQNTTHSTVQIAEQLNSTIESLFNQTERFIDIGKSDYVKNFLLDQSNQYGNAKAILEQFGIYRSNFPFSSSITNIYVIGKNQKAISERKGVFAPDTLKGGSANFSVFFDDPSTTHIFTGNMEGQTQKQYMYIGKGLVKPALREAFGAVVIEINSDLITDFCNSVDIAGTGSFSVMNQSAQIIFGDAAYWHGDASDIYEKMKGSDTGSFVDKLNGENTFFVYNTSARTGWKLIGQVPVSQLMKQSQAIATTTFGALLLVVVFALVLYAFFSGKIIYPLRRLKATMQIAALGDMSIRFESKTQDEIKDLGNSFNLMIEQIDSLAKQNLRRQTSLQKAEFNLLQAQINPHFLYNTLDTILWLANAQKTQEVSDMVEALCLFFRTTLSKGRDWISVEDELALIRNYLIIQKIRYSDILTYHIDVPPSLQAEKILKLTLQPLVENALYHGLKNKRGGGNIWITAKDCGNCMHFYVQDDGAGMTVHRYEAVRDELKNGHMSLDPKENGGFGLNNVNSRIKLFYGESCGIAIHARKPEGTIVDVCLRKGGTNV